MKRVGFLICGTQKGGTTALADYLRGHPELFIPEKKELHFFDDETQDWTRPDYRGYHLNYQHSDRESLWGEASPIYMYWEDSCRRIWRYNRAMKLIVTLRNPISRAYSHWTMERRRGAEGLSFEDAIRQEAVRCRSALPNQHRVFSYLDRGFYSEQLRRLWRYFPKEAVLVLRQEDLYEDPGCVLNRVCEHLNVSAMIGVKRLVSHASQYEEPMHQSTKELLIELYWHEICCLEALLGWDCQNWLKA